MARRRALPVDCGSSSATEPSALRLKLEVKKLLHSSSGNSVGLQSSSEDSAAMDDRFWIENIRGFTADEYSAAVKRHSRRPDLTMSIRMHMRSGRYEPWQVCSGVYNGHGQSKTAFRIIN